ncbi:hypothetical protein ACFXKJ_21000 [Kitasatospora indigofera]|uniref:hypothetical protein n=1 Tax=Kitasatospora indigofera TaxID=67307 RepID=UPI0036509E95
MSGFDFLAGEWDVANRRLRDFLDPRSGWQRFDATSRCWSLFDGAANIDEMDCPDQGFKGLTLRLFDRETEEWSLHWSTSRSGRLDEPVRGRFGADGTGEFHGEDTYAGTGVRVRYRWSGIGDRTARWEQAFAVDGGDWLVNWVMDFTRRG